MKNKGFSSILFFVIITLFYNLVITSCAQVAAPPGGKKDTLAPILISSIPIQKSKNYTGKKIELLFNEYVEIKNVNQELLVTPAVGFYETKINPKGLTLVLDSALLKNTTYTFNFRNAVSDISERNIAKNVKVVFSTGNLIDSLSIKGNVKNLHLNKNVDNALVALYNYSDTLALDKIKPRYFTKTDTSGNYVLENIAAGKYLMSSFIDANNNLLINANKEPFGLLSEKYVDLKQNIDNKNFKISIQNTDSLKIQKTTVTAKSILYEFNRGLKEVTIQSTKKIKEPLVYQIENKQNLRLFKGNLNVIDTLFLDIETKDSLNRTKIFKVKSKLREANKKEKRSKQVVNFTIYPRPTALFSPIDSIQIDFEKPITTWNIDKIFFQKDSTHRINILKNQVKINSFANQLIIPASLLPKEKTKLILQKNAFISIEQDSSETYELEIAREDLENYGLISGKLIQPEKSINYIIQLINEREQLVAYQTVTKEHFLFQHILPEIYLIKVIEDRNGDGYWTPGDIKKKELPERIFFYNGKLKLKANFELTDILIPIQ